MDVKNRQGGKEGLKKTTLSEGKVSQVVGKKIRISLRGI